jgi:hypothetical protein
MHEPLKMMLGSKGKQLGAGNLFLDSRFHRRGGFQPSRAGYREISPELWMAKRHCFPSLEYISTLT